jgi:hypothetical protein
MIIDWLNEPFVTVVFEMSSFFTFKLIKFGEKTSFGLFEFFKKINIRKLILQIGRRFFNVESLRILEFVGLEFDKVLSDFQSHRRQGMHNLESRLSDFFYHPDLLQIETVLLFENDVFIGDIFVDTEEKVRGQILDYVVLSSYESLYFEWTFAL